MKAECHHKPPPDDCPLIDWNPKALIAVWNPDVKRFDLAKLFQCQQCGVRWDREGNDWTPE